MTSSCTPANWFPITCALVPCSRAPGLVIHDVSPAPCSARTPSALLSIAAPRDVQSSSRVETELRQGPCHHRRKDRGTWIGRRSSIDARIQATAAIRRKGHHTPPHPNARQDYREARGMATAGLGLLGGPMALTRGCPAPHVRTAHCTAQPPTTAADAMRGICPPKGGGRAPRKRRSLDPACQGAAMPLRRATHGAHVRSKTSYGTGGGAVRRS